MTIDTERLRRLRAEGTQGEWSYVAGRVFGGFDLLDEKRDAPLIVAAVNALPALCDAVDERDRLRGERDELARLTSATATEIRAALGRLGPTNDRYDGSLADSVRAVVAERAAALAEVERLRERVHLLENTAEQCEYRALLLRAEEWERRHAEVEGQLCDVRDAR